MAKAHRREDGELELETSDGIRLPWKLGDKRLADLGIDLPAARGLDPQATAFWGDSDTSSGAGGVGNTPSKLDAPRETPGSGGYGGAGSGAGGSTGRTQDQGGSVGAPGSEEQRKAEPKTTEAAPKEKSEADRVKRGGGELESLDFGGGSQPQQRSAPARLIKGGDRRVAFSVQRGANPESLGELKDSIDDSRSAETQLANVQTDQRMDMDAYKARQLDDEIKYQSEKLVEGRARIQQIRDTQAARQAEIDTEREKVAALEQDPHNYWASKSTGTKVLSVLASVIAGAASGYNGRPNEVLARIDRLIAEDMAEHKGRIAARKGGAQLKQDELDKLMAREDPDIAEREVEARKYARTAAMLEKFALDTGNPAVIAQNRALAAQIRQAAAEKWTAIDADRGDRITEQWQYQPDRVVGGAGPALKPEQRERLVTFGGGKNRGFVVAGNAREKVQTAVTGYENLANGYAELRSLASQASAGNLDAQRAYNSLRSAILTEANVMRGQGAMSEGDQKNIEAGIPDVSSLTTTRANAETRIKEQESWAKSRLQSVIRDNVYQDPDAVAPAVSGAARGLRRE